MNQFLKQRREKIKKVDKYRKQRIFSHFKKEKQIHLNELN